nr:hypothetical protein [uncultured Tolumonas sp.]
MDKTNFEDILDDFIENADALNGSFPFIMGMLGVTTHKLGSAYSNYLKKHGDLTNDDGVKKTYNLPVEYQTRAEKLDKEVTRLKNSFKLIPRNFLVSLVSEFDSFLGAFIRSIYYKKPELLNESSRQITIADLLKFATIEDAKEQVLEKEIETLLRKSHSEQFSTLESKFKVKLTEFPSWSEYIEITERRNLFVHANGIASTQYISVCSNSKCKIGDTKVGDKLTVSSEYLTRAYQVILETAVKLTHVLWRKLFPEEREQADNSLINLGFKLISDNKNELAANILDFAFKIPKHHNDTAKRMILINLAQAYKWMNQPEKCNKTIKLLDWSAASYEFKLAVSVLNDEFDKASKLLKTVVLAEEISEESLLKWPIFNEFRKSEQFQLVFKELFNKDYAAQNELIKDDFDNHINDEFKLDEFKDLVAPQENIAPELEMTNEILANLAKPNVV